MTRPDLGPGPATDAAVAREVMGWRLDMEQNVWWDSKWEKVCAKASEWTPSVNGDHADQVVERLRELGFETSAFDPLEICKAALAFIRETRARQDNDATGFK